MTLLAVKRPRGLAGLLFLPADRKETPGVLLLGGSEGGYQERHARLLAEHGYAVLALAYFGSPGVPVDLVNVPVEYFGCAIDYLAAHDRVDGDRLAVVGGSFGGEAALLTASHYPRFRAVVSVLGSGVITQGIVRSTSADSIVGILGNEVSPFTVAGTPMQFVATPMTSEMQRQLDVGHPIHLRHAFVAGLADRDRLSAATIPIERNTGSVLLISAGDDQSWPCEALSDIAEERLRRHNLPVEHLRHPSAGHGIIAPPDGLPTPATDDGPGTRLALGGSTEANDAARLRTWQHTLEFLRVKLTVNSHPAAT